MATPDDKFPTATFEEKMKMMSVMSKADQKRASENLPYICKEYCGKCPTNKGTGETNLVFCSLGKSAVMNEKKIVFVDNVQ